MGFTFFMTTNLFPLLEIYRPRKQFWRNETIFDQLALHTSFFRKCRVTIGKPFQLFWSMLEITFAARYPALQCMKIQCQWRKKGEVPFTPPPPPTRAPHPHKRLFLASIINDRKISLFWQGLRKKRIS